VAVRAAIGHHRPLPRLVHDQHRPGVLVRIEREGGFDAAVDQLLSNERARHIAADASDHPRRRSRGRRPDGGVGGAASRTDEDATVDVATLFERLGLDADVDHHVADGHHVHGANPTGYRHGPR
jgi:hypothetical protein